MDDGVSQGCRSCSWNGPEFFPCTDLNDMVSPT